MRGARAEHRPRNLSHRQAPSRPGETLDPALQDRALPRIVEVTRPGPQRKGAPGPIQHGIDRRFGGAPDALAAPAARERSHRLSIRLVREGGDIDELDEP